MGEHPSVALTPEASDALDDFVDEHRFLDSRRQAASHLITDGVEGGDIGELVSEGRRVTAGPYSADRLEYVLESLDESEELANGLRWDSTVWGEGSRKPCTVEELIGGLLEADCILEAAKELSGDVRVPGRAGRIVEP